MRNESQPSQPGENEITTHAMRKRETTGRKSENQKKSKGKV
jgi:hypothetical protein